MDNETVGGGRKSILIVDDDPVIRRLLGRKLSAEGYRCEEADSAEQLFDKLSNNSFELVILDIRMQGRSGLELLPEIKANYADTAIVMATAVDDVNTAIQCLRQGAAD